MNREKRLEIVKEYRDILGKATQTEEAKKKMAYPESLLPYPKKEIKEALVETLKTYEETRGKIEQRFKGFSEESQKLGELSETFFEGETKTLKEVVDYIKFAIESLKDFIPDRKWRALSDDMNQNIKEWAKRRRIKK